MSYKIEKVLETCPCGAQICIVSSDSMVYIIRFHKQHEGCIKKNPNSRGVKRVSKNSTSGKEPK